MYKRTLLSLPRRQKRFIQLAADTLLVWLSLYFAFAFRISIAAANASLTELWPLYLLAPVIAIAVFIPLGMYRAVIRYLGKEALITVARAVTISALIFALLVYWYGASSTFTIPRSMVLNYWLFSLLFLGGLRLLMRHYLAGNLVKIGKKALFMEARQSKAKPVLIYGAGSAGNQLLIALRMSNEGMNPVGFIDDDETLHGSKIAGLYVYGSQAIPWLIEHTAAEQVLLAIPSTSRQRRSEILQYLQGFPLRVLTIPGMMDLACGRVKVQDLQDVDIADLLGRDAVEPRQDLIDKCIKGHAVMVTGAGGSIGSELCRQIVSHQPEVLVLFESSEFNLYSIHQELNKHVQQAALAVRVVPILASIRERERMVELMKLYQIDTVYHAAAYKHVPLVEMNVVQGVLNNVIGTLKTAQAAIAAGVSSFVLVSTDKAVRPTNVMGSTKRLAELLLQALSKEQQVEMFERGDGEVYANNTRFTMVRFGNVLGSSGSVIPLFRRQISAGGPVTVTHPKITRYFMTIPEAAQLVIQAGAMGHGGDVFVLDMGEPVTIVELAQKMIALTGLSEKTASNPAGDIEIQFTGLRPGEKLYEELLIGDNDEATEHPKIKRANEIMKPWQEMEAILRELLAYCDAEDHEAIRRLLRRTIDGYTPSSDIVDLIHVQRQRSQYADEYK